MQETLFCHVLSGSWVQAGTPHQPVSHLVTMQSGVLCNPAASRLQLFVAMSTATLPEEGGRKDDLAVALLDLQRTASTLKQPVPFVDKPAALFVAWLENEGAGQKFLCLDVSGAQCCNGGTFNREQTCS